MTDRPNGVIAGSHTADDGLFGPDSVTWRVTASQSTSLAGTAAALVQMLFPPVMYVIDQSSRFREDPERRGRLTGDYTVTITYGDTDSAEQAGAFLRRLHGTRKAVDPHTGQHYQADDRDLLAWVHNALSWTLVRCYQAYGPALDTADADKFVAEQRAVAGRLVGCTLEDLPDTVGELNDYMDGMLPKLALSTPALWFRDLVVPAGRPKSADAVLRSLFVQASIQLMGPAHRQLYGFGENRFRDTAAKNTVRWMLAGAATKLPVDRAIPQMREYIDSHAFGARRVKLVDPTVVSE